VPFWQRSDFFSYWSNQCTTIRRYWEIYGGFGALIRSPYVHLALLFTLVCLPFWQHDIKAFDVALGVIPNLLGYTVGALAIVLAFSSAKIFAILAEKGNPHSFFMKLTANLIHFILVQALALIFGTLAKITGATLLDVLTLFFAFYAVMVTVAAGLQLFLTAIIYNTRASLPDRPADNVGGETPDSRADVDT
jgi:hypothetical protein